MEPAKNDSTSYGEFARYYDVVTGNAVIPTIVRCFEQSRRRYGIAFASVADVGCGTGTFLLHLARHCEVLYGVDKLARMLSIARKKLARRNVALLWQDLRELRLPSPVDLVTCTFDTRNYFTTAPAIQACLLRIRDNLVAGGHFVFDIITGAGAQFGPQESRQEIRLPDAVATWRFEGNATTGLSRVEMLWRSRARSGHDHTWREVHWQRWYPIPLISALLSRCGFRVLGVHDMASFDSASSLTWWAHFVTTRPSLRRSSAPKLRGQSRGGPRS
jgi:SAM-dependent methyltransferase